MLAIRPAIRPRADVKLVRFLAIFIANHAMNVENHGVVGTVSPEHPALASKAQPRIVTTRPCRALVVFMAILLHTDVGRRGWILVTHQ